MNEDKTRFTTDEFVKGLRFAQYAGISAEDAKCRLKGLLDVQEELARWQSIIGDKFIAHDLYFKVKKVCENNTDKISDPWSVIHAVRNLLVGGFTANEVMQELQSSVESKDLSIEDFLRDSFYRRCGITIDPTKTLIQKAIKIEESMESAEVGE